MLPPLPLRSLFSSPRNTITCISHRVVVPSFTEPPCHRPRASPPLPLRLVPSLLPSRCWLCVRALPPRCDNPRLPRCRVMRRRCTATAVHPRKCRCGALLFAMSPGTSSALVAAGVCRRGCGADIRATAATHDRSCSVVFCVGCCGVLCCAAWLCNLCCMGGLWWATRRPTRLHRPPQPPLFSEHRLAFVCSHPLRTVRPRRCTHAAFTTSLAPPLPYDSASPLFPLPCTMPVHLSRCWCSAIAVFFADSGTLVCDVTHRPCWQRCCSSPPRTLVARGVDRHVGLCPPAS